MGQKLGLALAGGGALGSYEVGAIEALEELGFHFDVVSGTSIGALNGAFLASHAAKRLRPLWSNITADKVMVNGVDISKKLLTNPSLNTTKEFNKWYWTYFKNGLSADITPFKKYIKDALDVDAALNSDMEFGVVTTSFPSMKLVDVNMKKVDKDKFLPFLHASSACTPIFPPEIIDGKRYIDGFFNDNLPIRLAFKLGADEVIAIDMRLFSLKPQNRFFLTLPNVSYIAPYIPLGSMVDFSQESIQKYMKLGYLDTMKFFKKYRGFYFCFQGEIPSSGFLADLIHEYGTDSEWILDELKKDSHWVMDEKDYFVRAMEDIAIRLDVKDYYDCFTMEEFASRLREAIKQKKANQGFLSRTFQSVTSDISTKRRAIKTKFLIEFGSKYLKLTTPSGRPLLTKYLLNGINKKEKEA